MVNAAQLATINVSPAVLGSNINDVSWNGKAPTIYRTVDIEAANEKLAKLNKRARKLGIPEVGFRVVDQHEEFQFVVQDSAGEVWHEWRRSRGEFFDSTQGRPTGAARVVYSVVLTGVEELKLSGWSFLAVLDHELGEDNTIVRAVPDADLPADWKHKNNHCDHCKRSQVRKQTFVVKHEDGRLYQVGSTCIRDFLGHEVAKVLGRVEICALLKELFDGEMGYGGGGGGNLINTIEFLAWVAKEIRENGWVSRGKAYETGYTATADIARNTMLDYGKQR